MIKKFIYYSRTLIYTSAFISILNISNAAFTLVENFETYKAGPANATDNDKVSVAGYDEKGNRIGEDSNRHSRWQTNKSDKFSVIKEIGKNNKALEVKGGQTCAASLPSMPNILKGSTATVYYRIKLNQSNAYYDTRIGPAGKFPINVTNQLQPRAGLFIKNKNMGSQSSLSSQPENAQSHKGEDEWRHIWMVVNAENNTYSIYEKYDDGDDAEPQPLFENKKSQGTPLATDGTYTDFLIFSYKGPDLGYYIDDIYIDLVQKNLTKPKKDYALINNFEYYDTGTITPINLGGRNNPATSKPETDNNDPFMANTSSPSQATEELPFKFEILSENDSANQFLIVSQGNAFVPFLPDIPDREIATVYYRIKPIHPEKIKSEEAYLWYHVWIYIDRVNNEYSIYILKDDGQDKKTAILVEKTTFENTVSTEEIISDFHLFNSNTAKHGYHLDDIYFHAGAKDLNVPSPVLGN